MDASTLARALALTAWMMGEHLNSPCPEGIWSMVQGTTLVSSHQSGWWGHHPISHRYAMVAEMGPLTAFHLSLGPASNRGLARWVQSALMRFRITEEAVTHV